MAEYSETTLSDLIINRLSKEKYLELSSQGLISEEEIYLVEEDFLDGLGKPVINVGSPTLSNDAANKAYVDDEAKRLSSEISSAKDSLSNYVPLSGDELVENSLSIGSELYVQDRSLSTILSEDASRVFFREWD